MYRTRGQVSIEFLALVSFLVLFFVIYMPFFWQQQLDIEVEKQYLIGEKIAISVKKEINTAVMFSSGYRRNFTLPKQISDADYTITIENKVLKIRWRNRATEENLIAHNISGNPKVGFNTIENRNDVIYLNE